jgi:hypothetical protein
MIEHGRAVARQVLNEPDRTALGLADQLLSHTEAKTGRVCGLPSRSHSGTMIQINLGARKPPKEFAQ